MGTQTEKIFSIHIVSEHRSLNAIYGRQPSAGSAPMMDAKGEHLITDKGKILERWGEHFDNVLNRPSSINEEAINRLPQIDMNPSLALLPTLDEVNLAIASLSSGKSPCSGGLPPKIFAAGSPTLVMSFFQSSNKRLMNTVKLFFDGDLFLRSAS